MEPNLTIKNSNNRICTSIIEFQAGNRKSKPRPPSRYGNSTKQTLSTQKFVQKSRQTTFIKRSKFTKASYFSKPIAISNYAESMFIMEPSIPIKQRPQHTTVPLGIMEPMYINVKPKGMFKFIRRKGDLDDSRVLHRKGKDGLYDNIVSDMNEYFNQMRMSSFNTQHYKRSPSRRKNASRSQQHFQSEDQSLLDELAIRRLQPVPLTMPPPESSLQLSRMFIQSEGCSRQDIQEKLNNGGKKRRTYVQEKDVIGANKKQVPQEDHVNKVMFKKKSPKKCSENLHFIFGQFKEDMSPETILKLKYLYYADYLFKLTLNCGHRYLFPSSFTPKYYVGHGNNSKLIRKLMKKRYWWTQQTKQQNAHFVWTQLKIYSVYQGQGTWTEQNYLKSQDYPEIQEDKNRYIMNGQKYKEWREYITRQGNLQKKPALDMSHRKNYLPLPPPSSYPIKITNHLQFSRILGNKKALYRTMTAYLKYISSYKNVEDSYIPLTYHITAGLQDEEYLKFLSNYYKKAKQGKSTWIVKPGEMSNRGCGIIFCKNLTEIKDRIKIKQTHANGAPTTYLIQQYIDRPLLYRARKFDLRHYLLLTSHFGSLRGYYSPHGYVRTASHKYSLTNSTPTVHLTNDAVQKYCRQYGKYEKGNKLSYNDMDLYLKEKGLEGGMFGKGGIMQQIRVIVCDIIKAGICYVDPIKRVNNFEVFGIDIMIDENFKCWLIEVNTNPCLELSSPVLHAVIPQMLDTALCIALDPLFPPNGLPQKSKFTLPANILLQNEWQLVFDQDVERQYCQRVKNTYQRENIVIVGQGGDDQQKYESCAQQDDEDG